MRCELRRLVLKKIAEALNALAEACEKFITYVSDFFGDIEEQLFNPRAHIEINKQIVQRLMECSQLYAIEYTWRKKK